MARSGCCPAGTLLCACRRARDPQGGLGAQSLPRAYLSRRCVGNLASRHLHPILLVASRLPKNARNHRRVDALCARFVQQQLQSASSSAQSSAADGNGGKGQKMTLQKSLSLSTSAEEVLQLCSTHAAVFDHIHAATAVNRLGLFTTTAAARRALVSDPRAAALAAVLQANAGKLNAQGVANVFWGLARLAPEYAPPAALLAALEQAASRPATWTNSYAQALGNAAWAYARLAGSSAKRCELAVQLRANASKLTRFCRRSDVLDVIVAAALPSASSFKRQELVQLLHACGSAGLKSRVPGFSDVTWSACDAIMEQFKPHELAIVLWSFARMNCSPGDEALQRAASLLATHAGDLDMQASRCVLTSRGFIALRHAARQAVSNGLWALAVLWTKPDSAILARLVECAQRMLPTSTSPQAISNVLWAVAKLRYDPGPSFVADTVARALALADALGCDEAPFWLCAAVLTRPPVRHAGLLICCSCATALLSCATRLGRARWTR